MLEQIERPIVIFDLETTGTDVNNDKIVQIYMQKHLPGAQIREKVSHMHTYINPERPIPPAATAIHGIADSDVEFLPPFKEIASEIAFYMMGCDIAGHNIMAFDIPLLLKEFDRCGIESPIDDNTNFYDTQKLFTHILPRTLKSTFEFFTGRTWDDSKGHDAEYDTGRCGDSLWNMLNHDLAETSIDQIHQITMPSDVLDFDRKFVVNPEGWVVFNFGGKKGEKIIDHKDYVEWMRRQTFSSNTMKVADKALKHDGRWPG